MEANEAAAPRAVDRAELVAEAASLGLPTTRLRVESLTHNPLNMVTDELHRISWDDGATKSAVRKVVTRGGQGEQHWRPSEDPRHWNYWRREADVYQSDLPGRLGMRAPTLLGSFERGDDVVLWLDAVTGTTGIASTVDSLGVAANALGRAQGPADLPDDDFLSRGFVAEYAASKPAPISLLYEDAAWEHPLIEQCWPASIRSDFQAMYEGRSKLHDLLLDLPRTVAHLDVWPNNIIGTADGPVFLDWAFCGDGAVGEDIGNLIPDAVLDLLIPSEDLPELERVVFDAYVGGLRDVGWTGADTDVRLAMMASAVKYYWLVPLLLDRVGAEKHLAYGVPADPAHLYAERGVALARLGEWARKALAGRYPC